MKIQIKINGKVEKEFEADDYALCHAAADVNDVIKRERKIITRNDTDRTGAWYVVKKNTAQRALNGDGTPIIEMSHEAAYRIGFNIGLSDCLWWCPMRVEDYEQKYGEDVVGVWSRVGFNTTEGE